MTFVGTFFKAVTHPFFWISVLGYLAANIIWLGVERWLI